MLGLKLNSLLNREQSICKFLRSPMPGNVTNSDFTTDCIPFINCLFDKFKCPMLYIKFFQLPFFNTAKYPFTKSLISIAARKESSSEAFIIPFDTAQYVK